MDLRQLKEPEVTAGFEEAVRAELAEASMDLPAPSLEDDYTILRTAVKCALEDTVPTVVRKCGKVRERSEMTE